MGDELAVHERLTEWTGAATPVPVIVTAVGEFDALLSKEAATEARPLVCGVNVTVKFALCPADIVTGNEIPLMANSELPTLTEDTVTLALVALSVPVWLPLVPTVTLPTLIVAGMALNCPAAGPVADPLKIMFRFGLEAFEAIATLPLKLPDDAGAKVTLKDVLCPAASVSGMLSPEILKPVPATEPCEMVALDPPVFCTVSVCV